MAPTRPNSVPGLINEASTRTFTSPGPRAGMVSSRHTP